MTPCTLFSLIAPAAQAQKYTSKCTLAINAVPSTTTIPGIHLLRQYKLQDGYLLITDYDNPWEESIEVVLLNRQFKLISVCAPNSPFFAVIPGGIFGLSKVDWINERTLMVHSDQPEVSYEIFIRAWGIPYLWPRLRARKLPTSAEIKLKKAKEIVPCSKFALIQSDKFSIRFSKKSILAKRNEIHNKEIEAKLGIPESDENGFRPTKTRIIGKVLRRQYSLSDCYLLITQPRDSHKKIAFAVLLSGWGDAVIGTCVLNNFSIAIASDPKFLLANWEDSGDRIFALHCDDPHTSYEVQIRPWGIGCLRSRLVARKRSNAPTSPSKQR